VKTTPKAIVLAIICTILVTCAQILMKLALNTGKELIPLVFDPFFILGIVAMIGGGLLLTLALRSGELSVIHPLLSLGFVWVVIMSGFIGESVTAFQYAGIASIVIGVSFISQSRVRA